MKIVITKQTTSEGDIYSISGLSLQCLLSIKHAMFQQGEHYQRLINGPFQNHPQLKERFEERKQECVEVVDTIREIF